jgi:hypothetical protein
MANLKSFKEFINEEFVTEKKYTVEYWYRDRDDKDIDSIDVDASSEMDAIEKAMKKAKKNSIASTFKIKKP